MNELPSWSLSENPKSAIQNPKWLAIFAIVFTFVFDGAVVEAQQRGKIYRVGYLSGASAENDKPLVAAFRHGLQELGYIEGKNIVIEQRYSAGGSDRLPQLAAELVGFKVDVVLVYGLAAALAVKKADNTLPIVMANVADPVGTGLVASLARPGGNVTGLSDYHFATITKRLELIKEVVPQASRIAVLLNPTNAHNLSQLKDLEAVAPALGVTLLPLEAKGSQDIDPDFIRIAKERAGALLIVGDAMLSSQQGRIAELALKSRLPSGYTLRRFVEVGGLMSYGTSFAALFHRAAWYVDKILKGTKPADLPVEQPTKFDLLFNLKTAKQIGLIIPPNVLARADRVIR